MEIKEGKMTEQAWKKLIQLIEETQQENVLLRTKEIEYLSLLLEREETIHSLVREIGELKFSISEKKAEKP
jgi:hypothetical protein